jgi:translocation and assembly module TamB
MTALILVAVVSILALARSERFSIWLLETLEAQAAGRIALSDVAGTFADEIRVGRVDVRLEAGLLTLEDMRVRFDLGGILARALIVDAASIGRATFDATADGFEAAPTEGSTALPVLMLIRSLRLGSIVATTADGTYELGATALGARYVDGTLDLSDLSTRWQELEAEATAHVEIATVLGVQANVCVRGTFESENVSGCVRIGGAYPALTVAAETSAPFVATAEGSVTVGSPSVVDVDLRWRDAAFARLAGFRSPEAAFHVFGPLDQIRAAGSAELIYDNREFGLDLSIVRGSDAFLIESLTAAYAGMSVGLDGTVAADFSRASLSISGNHIDPALLYEDWQGDLELRGQLTAFTGPRLIARLDDLAIGGQLRGYPIAATGGLDIEPDQVTFRDLRVLSRVDQVALAGTLGETSDLAVRAEINDLAAWWPELAGSLDANLLMRGPLTAPSVSGDLMLRDAKYEQNAIASLVVSGEAGLGESDALAFVAGISGLQIGDVVVDEASAEVNGTLGAHSATIRARADQWSVAGRADGGLDARTWRGELVALDVDPAGFEPWSLERPASAVVGEADIEVGSMCLSHAEARICVEMKRTGAPDDFVRIDASDFDVDILSPLLPPGLDVGGRLDARVEFEDASGEPNGQIRIQGRSGHVRTEIAPGTDIDVPIEALLVDATVEQGRLTLQGELDSPEFANARFDVTVDDLAEADSPLSAAVDLVWLDTAVLTVLSPDVGDVGGTIYVDVDVRGRLDAPAISGSARLEQGSIEVPVWGLLIENIDGRADFTDTNRVRYTAQGSIDEATVFAEGETDLDRERRFPTTLRLHGDSVRLVQVSGAEVYVSPDLSATVALPNIEVTGRVDIPRARIETATELSTAATTPSRDAIVHGREEVEPARPLDVTAALTVSLGDDVRYHDGKLNAQVAGDLEITYESEIGARAVGGLVLTGDYDAFGTLLTLEQGRLTFGGPWNNPSVDVRAVRHVEEVTVGVQLTGTLAEPQTRIFSEPAMSETNALSYLLFGRPLDDTVDQNRTVLENAAISMGLLQALPAIQRIGQSLGLDEFAIRGTTTDAGELMAGKYLSPSLYLRYSYGLFNRVGGLLLRYRINERFSLETLSGEQKSMDLLYTVEKE